MGRISATLVALLVVFGLIVNGSTADADAICNDGSYSDADGQGACSWHEGVDHWIETSPESGQHLAADEYVDDDQPWRPFVQWGVWLFILAAAGGWITVQENKRKVKR